MRTKDYEIKIIPNESGNPPGKLADAEIHHFTGIYAGLKLIGWAIWERRGGGGRNVTFPARQYRVNGERRSFALLRPISDSRDQQATRDLILQAYEEYETVTAVQVGTMRAQEYARSYAQGTQTVQDARCTCPAYPAVQSRDCSVHGESPEPAQEPAQAPQARSQAPSTPPPTPARQAPRFDF